MSDPEAPWPIELRLRRAANVLEVAFDNGDRRTLTALDLRRASPSAAHRGHGAARNRSPPDIADDIRLTALSPVGRYAVRIVFSDGHDSGLYTWPLLHGLGRPDAART